MKTTLTILAACATLAATSVFADDDDCFAPLADWQPRDVIMQLAAEQGWDVRRIKIDDGCYKIKGRDAQGREIEAVVHPATLVVIEFEYEDEDHDETENDDDDHHEDNNKDDTK